MVGFQLGVLTVVVQLDTRRSHSGPQHFSFPVVDGDLQVADVRLHRRMDGLWKIYYSTKISDYYQCGVSLREMSFQAKYLRTEAAYLPSAAGGSLLQQDNPRGQLDSIGRCSLPPKAAPLLTDKENQIKLGPRLHRDPVRM